MDEAIEEEIGSAREDALPPKNNIRDENLSPKQLFLRYAGTAVKLTCIQTCFKACTSVFLADNVTGYKKKTVKQLAIMKHGNINLELIEDLIVWICSGNHDVSATVPCKT